jgi:hypothetical protein
MASRQSAREQTMNHFLLWAGPNSVTAAAGDVLLGQYKSIGQVSSISGKNWRISYAAQQDGLGAFRDDRRRLASNDGDRQLFWFGHAWSKTDGPQPPFTLLRQCAADLPNVALIQKAREHCNGVFALVMIDAARAEIVVAADSLGSFHVYHRSFKDGIAISNSSSLLAGLPPHATLDPLGVQELCSNSVANEDRSIWNTTKKLRSGQILKVDAARPRAELVDHRPLLSVLDGIRDYAADPVTGLFGSISDVLLTIDRQGGRGPEFRELPWVADLTGGNDSRALVAAVIANHIHVASTVSGPATDPDVQIGARLAKQLGIAHFPRSHPGPLTATQFFDALSLTDGEFDAVEYAGVAAVHRQHIRDGLQFSLNGSYCEVGRGHAWRLGLAGMLFPDHMAAGLTQRKPLTLGQPSVGRWGQLCSLKNPANLFSPDARATSANYFPGIFERLLAYAGHLPQHAQLDLIHLDLRMERWQGRLASCTNQIWPAISPWGFQEPLTQMLTSSPAIRRNGLLTRSFTLDYAPALAREPLYTGNPAMPFSLRQAHRFLPVVPYFADRAWQKVLARFHHSGPNEASTASARQPLLCTDSEIRKWLAEPLLAESGLFDRDALVKLLSPDQPQTARMHQLWCRLLTLEAALRLQVGRSRYAAEIASNG